MWRWHTRVAPVQSRYLRHSRAFPLRGLYKAAPPAGPARAGSAAQLACVVGLALWQPAREHGSKSSPAGPAGRIKTGSCPVADLSKAPTDVLISPPPLPATPTHTHHHHTLTPSTPFEPSLDPALKTEHSGAISYHKNPWMGTICRYLRSFVPNHPSGALNKRAPQTANRWPLK